MRCLFTLLAILPFLAKGQLSIHAGLNVGDPASVYTNPYTDPDGHIVNFPIALPGSEIGYRFMERFELRAYYYFGKVDKGYFLDYEAHSQMQLYGLKPQITVVSWAEDEWHLDLAVPIGQLHEKVNWHNETWGLFTSKDSAAGTDHAVVNRLGLAPTLRAEIPEIRLTLEVSIAFYTHTLRSFRRKIYYDSFYPPAYENPKIEVLRDPMELRLSVGYSFW